MLIGHSGCNLSLITENEKIFVRKISNTIDYNTRLRAQCCKQQLYKGPFLTPTIFLTGYKNGLFFFDMEYIRGYKLSEYIHIIPIADCSTFFTRFVPIDYGSYNKRSVTIFEQKIADLRKKIELHDIIQASFNKLSKIDWGLIPESSCHGDMTLENILVQDGKLYFIDFLDSFYSSWMIDFAKLLQDVDVRWAYRKGAVDNNTHIRLLIIKESLISTIKALKSNSIELIYALLVLNLLRILPYTKLNEDKEFIYKALRKVL